MIGEPTQGPDAIAVGLGQSARLGSLGVFVLGLGIADRPQGRFPLFFQRGGHQTILGFHDVELTGRTFRFVLSPLDRLSSEA